MIARRRLTAKLLLTAATTSALVFALPSAASAGPATAAAPTVTVVNSQLAAPFNIATHRGRVYVADGFQSKLFRLRGTALQTVADGPQPGEVAGVDVSRNGRYLAYTTVEAGPPPPNGPPPLANGALTILGPYGSRVTADLAGYEETRNPDGNVTYGTNSTDPCVTAALGNLGQPAKYKGIVDSHPYSVAAWGRNSWVVADAAGNNLLSVSRKGKIRNLAVLPRQPLTITAALAEALELPDCVVGVRYAFEAVPTDVEVGRGGWLYVSTLPGGPEDPSAGARGSVYRVNPWTGRSTLVASGFAGATNLAIGAKGEIYVAELFAGRISVIKNGQTKPYVSLPGAVSVESDGRNLWAGTLASEPSEGNPGAPGTLVKITR